MDAADARNPAALPDHTPEKQSELKLNVGIGVLGTFLSVFCAFIFFVVEVTIPLGIVMTVVSVVSAAVTAYAYNRQRRAARDADTAGSH